MDGSFEDCGQAAEDFVNKTLDVIIKDIAKKEF